MERVIERGEVIIIMVVGRRVVRDKVRFVRTPHIVVGHLLVLLDTTHRGKQLTTIV